MSEQVRLRLKDGVLTQHARGNTLQECKTHAMMDNVKGVELKWKGLDDRFCAACSSLLRGCKNLVSIDLSDNYIGDSGCKELAECLTTMTHFEKLSLPGNKIGDLGFAMLSSMLAANQSITELDLSGNSGVQKTGLQVRDRDSVCLATQAVGSGGILSGDTGGGEWGD